MKFPRMKLTVILFGAFAILAGVFNNCSKVRFALDEASVADKLNSGGGIFINKDAPYTNSAQVDLTLVNGSASEMYVTNDPECKSGGDWEPYAPEKPWTLANKNAEVKVYVKYREEVSSAIESDCFSDSIVEDEIPPTVEIRKGLSAFINASDAAIEFHAADALSGVDSVECSQDGSAGALPCFSTHQMSGLNEGPHSAQIVARDKAGNLSAPVEVAFNVDKTPPTVVLNSMPALLTGDSLAQFRFTGTDSYSGLSGYQCRIDANPAQPCSSPFSTQLGEGSHTFEVTATDVAGNKSAPVTYTWQIDQSAPALQFTQVPNAISNSSSATFAFTGLDDGKVVTNFQCQLDGAAFQSCTSPQALTGLTAGQHTFYVRAIDSANNVSAPISYTWIIDLIKPTVTISLAPDVVTNRTTATFGFSAQDAQSGIDKIECQVDSGAFQACSNKLDLATVTEGTHKFTVRATDRAGNVSDPAVYEWRVDLTKPTIQILTGPASPTKLTTAEFTMKAEDPGGEVARIECKLEYENYSTCTSPKLYQAMQEGPHLFSARAVDKAGNVSDVKTWAWTVDISGPAINFGQVPLSTIGQLDKAPIQFTVTDPSAGVDTVVCTMDGATETCGTDFTKTYERLPVGTHTFTVVATDKLGNESRKEVTFTVEKSLTDKIQTVQIDANKKLDVLVVIDNSGSMATEQSNMAQRFGTFLDQLNGLDWQVGIVTTDLSSDASLKDGRLVAMTGLTNTYILNSSMDPAQARTVFGNSIQRKESGSGNEQGIGATYRAVQRSLDSTNSVNAPNAALFRQGAGLAVLVVTDADETNPAGLQERNKPEGLVNLVKNTWNNQKPFTFHSIIVPLGDSACKSINGNENYGYSYESLSKLTGGVVGSVCASDYGSQLTAIGKVSAQLVNSVTLDCAPVDVNGDGKADLTVELSPSAPAPSFTLDGTKVTFAQALPIGQATLRYTCLAVK